MKHLSRHIQTVKNLPLWKRIIIIAIVIAMPAFFFMVRQNQLAYAEVETNALSQSQ
jgi:hypothetical protein